MMQSLVRVSTGSQGKVLLKTFTVHLQQITHLVEKGQSTYVIPLDFSKNFDAVSHSVLNKISSIQIG